MLICNKNRGFSLLELLVGVAIIGVMMSIAIPNFRDFFVNMRIQSAAESYLAGVQKARSEAISRNLNVEIDLTDDPIVKGTTENSVTPSSAGRNWLVRYKNPNFNQVNTNDPTCATSSQYCFVEAKSSAEGASAGGAPFDASLVVTPNPSWAGGGGPSGTVYFTSLSTSSNVLTPFQVEFSHATQACQSAGGPVRCLAVRISPGGQSRLCDPAVTAAGDNRKCG